MERSLARMTAAALENSGVELDVIGEGSEEGVRSEYVAHRVDQKSKLILSASTNNALPRTSVGLT